MRRLLQKKYVKISCIATAFLFMLIYGDIYIIKTKRPQVFEQKNLLPFNQSSIEDSQNKNTIKQNIKNGLKNENDIKEKLDNETREQSNTDISNDKINNILKLLNISKEDIVSDEYIKEPPYTNVMRVIETKTRRKCKFEDTSGILMYYRGDIAQGYKEITADEIISKEKAIDIATDFMSDLGITCDEQVVNCVNCAKYDNLADSRWVISCPTKYKGVPISYSYTEVWVAASDANVMAFLHRPTRDYPESMIQNISEDESTKTGKEFLRTKFREEYILESSVLGIAYPNNTFSNPNSDLIDGGTKPRLCWISNYTPTEGGYLITVFVDTETGKIIGGIQ